MKEIRKPQASFDAEAFFAPTIEFLGQRMSPRVDPTYAIVWVENSENVPVFGPESGWDVLSALKDDPKMIFLPFAYADADGTLTCADGNTYGPISDDEDSEDGLFIGLEDSIGYLVQVQDGTVTINSAIHAGDGLPWSSSTCGSLSKLRNSGEPYGKVHSRLYSRLIATSPAHPKKGKDHNDERNANIS